MSLTDLCRLGPKVIQIYPESSGIIPKLSIKTAHGHPKNIQTWRHHPHLVGEGDVQDIDDIDIHRSKSFKIIDTWQTNGWFHMISIETGDFGPWPVFGNLAGFLSETLTFSWFHNVCFSFALLKNIEDTYTHTHIYIYIHTHIICKYATHKTGHVLHDATCMVWHIYRHNRAVCVSNVGKHSFPPSIHAYYHRLKRKTC